MNPTRSVSCCGWRHFVNNLDGASGLSWLCLVCVSECLCAGVGVCIENHTYANTLRTLIYSESGCICGCPCGMDRLFLVPLHLSSTPCIAVVTSTHSRSKSGHILSCEITVIKYVNGANFCVSIGPHFSGQ